VGCQDGLVTENPRLDAFKGFSVMETMRLAGGGKTVTKDQLVVAARRAHPELFDDGEPCYPNCDKHPAKWIHLFDRAIYDLRSARPPKLRSGIRRGTYELA